MRPSSASITQYYDGESRADRNDYNALATIEMRTIASCTGKTNEPFVCSYLAGLAIVLILCACGCAKSEAVFKVKGKLVKGGSAFQSKGDGLPPGGKGIRVGFVKSDGDKAGEV